jgi:MFS family permease
MVSGRIAFRYPNFRYFMVARFLLVISTEMQAVAVGWQIYGLTHRPLDLGLAGLAQFLPGVFLFLVAGHTADRVPRQRILQGCHAGFALCSATLLWVTLHGTTVVWPIYLALVANGAVRVFNGPTGQAFLPALVPEEHFQNAVAWSASVFTAATILGPAVGGLLYGLTGSPAPVYAFAATAYLGGLGLVSMLRVPARAGGRPQAPASLDSVLEGLRFIRRKQMILGAISLDLFAVLLGGAVALLPVYAQDILHVGASGLGVLRAAPGAGAMLMATLLAYRPLRRRAGPAMLWCVAGFGVCTILFGLSRSLVLSLAALALVGACDMVSVVVRQTMVQLSTPDEMRGRVSAVGMIFIGASNELGQFESGITAQWFGAVPAVVLGGIGTLAVVALWTWRFPVLRRVDKLTAEALAPRRAQAAD